MFQQLLDIIGHFHPALVHLPIGSLILTYILFRVNGRGNRRNMRHAVNIGLFFSSVSSLVAVICGLLLARHGGYDETTLGWHKYLGFFVVLASLILWYSHQDIYKRDHSLIGSMFSPLFNLCMAALVIGGHLGGTLTHGKGYLFKSESEDSQPVNTKPSLLNPTASVDQNVYSEIIQPILNDKCTSCHNPDKKKGELILADSKGIFAGGKHGQVIVFGHPDSSSLYTNIMKPIEDDKHMPPDGKRQLNDTEKKLIAWWIKNHRSLEDKVSDYPAFEGLLSAGKETHAETFEFDLSRIPPADQKAISKLQSEGFRVYGLSQDNPLLDVGYTFKSNLDKRSIKLLEKINPQIYSLDLSNSNLDDELFENIGNLPHLVSLNLNNTKITDKGLANLQRFPKLKKLNLYQTKITDASLSVFKLIPELKAVYFWQTGITEPAIAQFKLDKPGVETVAGIRMDTLVKLKLPKPTIRTETDLFYDTIKVEFASFFKDAELRYTLDSSVPSQSSALYTQPLVLREPAKIMLIAYKEGWESSDTASRILSKAGFKVKEVVLEKDPPKRYVSDGPGTLTDLNRGNSAGDGKWLAYQKDDFVAQLQLDQIHPVSRVKISTLQSQGLWAYYPKTVDILYSTDGSKYLPAYTINYPAPKKDGPGGLKMLDLSFKPVEAAYVKVILRNLGKNPFWHKEKGKPSWVFCDEIIIE